MRVVIRPKLARHCNNDFWRKVQLLADAKSEIRIQALQKWLPLRTQERHWHNAIRRFAYVFDRNFATKYPVGPMVAQALPPAMPLQAAAAVEEVPEEEKSTKKRQRPRKE